jgi:2-keto-4-pentenoate hydratase/2-oxohepta-3-ene-1,7-dioic acid hydratase in catechol pathway
VKFARVVDNRTQAEEYALRAADDDGWVPLSTLGLQAADTPDMINVASEAIERLNSGDGKSVDDVTLTCPIVRPGKIIAVMLNYADHIRETGVMPPKRPSSFAKYASSLIGPYGQISANADVTAEPDYEGELAVVLARDARRASVADALSHVFGYTIANDVSARDIQRNDLQLSRAKSLDTFCPCGPWLTSADEVPDPQDLTVRTTVNDEIRQNSTTAEMIFSVAELISFFSQTMTLQAGDVILTGTPHGVGFARKPPVFLKAGDIVAVEIGPLGAICNRLVD